MTIAVLDAGALVHLAEIGSLPILTVFSASYVPAALRQRGRARKARRRKHRGTRECAQRKAVANRHLQTFTRRPEVRQLHLGERACLYLCQERDAHTLLTDAERRIEALHDVSSSYVTRAIVDLANEQLRRSTGGGG